MMKLKIDWKKLGAQLWEAVKPVLLGAVGAGIVAVTGCTSTNTTPRGQTTEIVAVGIPAVAWISHTSQEATHGGEDAYAIAPTNGTSVAVEVSK